MRCVCVRGDFALVGPAAAGANSWASASLRFSKRSDRYQRPNRLTLFLARSNSNTDRKTKCCADREVRRTGGEAWL